MLTPNTGVQIQSLGYRDVSLGRCKPDESPVSGEATRLATKMQKYCSVMEQSKKYVKMTLTGIPDLAINVSATLMTAEGIEGRTMRFMLGIESKDIQTHAPIIKEAMVLAGYTVKEQEPIMADGLLMMD